MTTATPATAIDPKTVDRALADLHARRWEIVDRLAATYRSIHHAIDDRQVTRSRWALTDIDAYERLVGLLDAPNPAPRLRDYAYLIDRVSQYRDERAVITAEIETAEAPYRANPWPRFYLVDRGHIHANPYCHTLRPSTRLGWLPDLSGDTEADAVTAHGPLLCTHCFPSAPVEWTVGPTAPEDPTMCSHKRMREWKTRGRYAWCGACGGVASVTSIGNLRKHQEAHPGLKARHSGQERPPRAPWPRLPEPIRGEPMSDTTTNRHGDEIRVGQLWLDNPARTVRRTLRVDGLEDAGALGTAAICTVISAHNQETGEITAPGRVVSIKVDSLHTTPSGKGYHLAEQAATVSEG